MEFLDHLLTREVGEKNREELKVIKAHCDNIEMEELGQLARVVRLRKMYDDKHQKLLIVLTDPKAMKLISATMRAIGATALLGAAPRGNLERTLEKFLEDEEDA